LTKYATILTAIILSSLILLAFDCIKNCGQHKNMRPVLGHRLLYWDKFMADYKNMYMGVWTGFNWLSRVSNGQLF
jgi:hypothetical protein